jgi:phosphate starvation-inducible membrane PsiE
MHEAYFDSVIIFIKAFPKYRFELLEIIIENLVYFDTEILIGDTYSSQHFPDVIFFIYLGSRSFQFKRISSIVNSTKI